MLKINLLPPEQRTVTVETTLPKQKLFIIVPLVIGLFILIHLYLGLAILIKSSQYKVLNNKWISNRASQEKVTDWKRKFNLATQDLQDIRRLTKQRILFAQKLKELSAVLPDGVWFNQMEVNQNKFILKGSVVSLDNDHMSRVREFIDNLKNSEKFYINFTSLGLGPVNMRSYKGYKLMDFIIEGNLK